MALPISLLSIAIKYSYKDSRNIEPVRSCVPLMPVKGKLSRRAFCVCSGLSCVRSGRVPNSREKENRPDYSERLDVWRVCSFPHFSLTSRAMVCSSTFSTSYTVFIWRASNSPASLGVSPVKPSACGRGRIPPPQTNNYIIAHLRGFVKRLTSTFVNIMRVKRLHYAPSLPSCSAVSGSRLRARCCRSS